MRILRKVIYFVFVIVLLTVLGILIYFTSQKPQYTGTMQLDGLKDQVEVIYDFYGVPHIYAKNEQDAYFALGYAHAQDRLFQMEMIRRVAGGRLSEVLGPDMVKVDKFFLTLGFDEHAKQSADLFLSGDSLPYQKAALAYLAGINQYIEKGRTPAEFVILGIPKRPFTKTDLYLTAEYMSFNFEMGFRTDPLMSFIHKKLGKSYYQNLTTHHLEGTEKIPNFLPVDTAGLHVTACNDIDEIMKKVPVPSFVGSNGWVVGPSKSKSGKVLFANDTHIGYSQPCVWYEAHIEYPGFSFYGNHLAGFPFAALGHSRSVAWGLTMFENDDLDFYTERIKPGDSTKCWQDGHWADLVVKEKLIHVKGEPDIKLTVRNSRRGPLVQEVMPEWNNITGNAVSAWWTHLKFPNNLMQVTYNMDHATNMIEMKAAVAMLVSPGLNVMYGDAAGNIAWWAAAKLIKRQPAMDPVLLQDGSTTNNDPLGWSDFEANPKSENPPCGYVYSANNQPDTMPGNGLYPGYYVPEDRAKRILQLLNDRDKYAIEDMQRMNMDAVSVSAPIVSRVVMDVVSRAMESKTPTHYNASKKLLTWDGDHQLQDVGPTIYYKLLFNILQLSMEDELGADNFKVFMSTHAMKNSILPLFENQNSVWWDDVNTRGVKETRNMIFDKAYDKTISELKGQLGENVDTWEWGRVHELEHVHPIGMKKPFDRLFNVGPYPVPGGQEVINQIAFDINGGPVYKAKYGPAMRIVIDFADIENSKSVLPTGQSGNVMSRYYWDQAIMYNSGKSRKQKMNRKEIELNKTGRLLLQPAM
jgi:penicillin amidase